MTRTISLITATVGAALLFAVPAWGDNWGGDRQDQAIVNAMAEDGFDDAVLAAKQNQVENMLNARERGFGVIDDQTNPLDARERALGAKYEVSLGSDFYADGFAQALQPRESAPSPVVDDRFRLDPTSGQNPVTVSSGREIELPQVGIAFGIGLLLALGLYLTLRYTRGRELVH